MKAIWFWLSHSFAVFFGFVLRALLSGDKDNDETRAEVRYKMQEEAEKAATFDKQDSELNV
jgi:hypothetical protein